MTTLRRREQRSPTGLPIATCVALSILASAGCSQPPLSATTWIDVAEGLQYAEVRHRGQQSQALIHGHALRFEPTRWQQVVVDARSAGAGTDDAASFRAKVKGIAAINAGFFDPKQRPLGLLVSAGKQVSRLRKVDHGVLTVTRRGDVKLQHARSYNKPADLDFAIECGPRLLVDGRPFPFKAGIAKRTAIGVDDRGFVLWFASDTSLSLADLAALMAAPAGGQGLGARQALNLDGGKSTMMDIDTRSLDASPAKSPSKEITVSLRSSVQVPIGLALVPRPQSP